MYSPDPTLIVEPDHFENGVPIFKPTMRQFKDFYQFNKAINKYGMKSGIVKIIPPKEWHSSIQHCYNEENLSRVCIRNPIMQNINNQGPGIYSQQNIEKQRKYNIFQWKELSKNYQPPKVDKGNETYYNIDTTQFTNGKCEELERTYWKSLTYAEPMYGADCLGSLFHDSQTCWNVSKLPNILDLMTEKLPGVNEAYLYAGLWKATFAWHLEDQDLYSINYIHFGAPKQWYSIPQEEEGKFFGLMKSIFNDEYKQCSEFLRHKTFLVSPQYLNKHGIRVNSVIHREGEFIITYPYGYHAGFNYDYNLAESVNFALDNWFPYGEVTKKCECISDSVGINVKQLWCKFHGKTFKEEEVETKVKRRYSTYDLPLKKSKNETILNECILCPNSLFNNLNNPIFELLPMTSNKKCHRICANTFPNELTYDNEIIHGFANISKEQKKLKCQVCKKSNEGACFQCNYKKCTRAYHATCGLLDGVQYFHNKSDNYCKFHRLKSECSTITLGSFVQFIFNTKLYFGEIINCLDEKHVEILVFPINKEVIEVNVDSILNSSSMVFSQRSKFNLLPLENNYQYVSSDLKNIPRSVNNYQQYNEVPMTLNLTKEQVEM